MKKEKQNRPKVIDLFAGVGGFSLGFEQAGFDIIAAVEIDPIHTSCHHYNFPNTQTFTSSIKDLTGEKILNECSLRVGDIDVVVGGPPCQGFSLIGQRAMDDVRNSLVKDFVRLVREIQPRFFVFENVKGLTLGEHKIFLSELIEEFKNIGYHVRLPWRVLNASNYGVPQNRERLILLGSRAKEELPDYPAIYNQSPTKSKSKKLTMDLIEQLIPGPTCKDALDDLPNAEDFNELILGDFVITKKWGHPSEYASHLRCLDDRGWYFGYKRMWNPDVLTSSMRAEHTEISRRRFAETIPGNVEPISRFLKLNPNGISNTLRAGTDTARGAFTSPRPIHYKYNRCITVREMARLHGFPDWFRFHQTKWHGARQIGNSVPPPLARAIASQIAKSMNYSAQMPNTQICLGDETLLMMTLNQAADFWGISVPVAKRDKKSGSKKRKQVDIENERKKAEKKNG